MEIAPFGLKEEDTPEYPRELGKDVASFRKLAVKLGGLSEMPRMARRGYGNAVLNAVRAKQKQALQRELPTHDVHCASRSNCATGPDILKAVAAQNRAAMFRSSAFDQKEANAKYEFAMAAKRAAEYFHMRDAA